MEPQRQLAEDAERAEGAHHQLGHVVPAHRLHHAGAPPGRDAVGLDEPHAEEQVAQRAVAQPERAARVGGGHAAERPRLGAGGIEREKLTTGAEPSRERGGGHARLHRDREVVGVVLEHLVEAAEVEDDVDPGRRRPELLVATRPPRHHGETRIPGQSEDLADMEKRLWPHHPARPRSVEGEAGGRRLTLLHPGSPHDRGERAPDRAGDRAHARSRRPRAGVGEGASTPRRRPGAPARAFSGS